MYFSCLIIERFQVFITGGDDGIFDFPDLVSHLLLVSVQIFCWYWIVLFIQGQEFFEEVIWEFIYFCEFLEGNMGVGRLDIEYGGVFPDDGYVLEEDFKPDIPLEPINGVLGVVGWLLILNKEGVGFT